MLFAMSGLPRAAAANDWTRYDRPWRYDELQRAIELCRLQPRVNPDVGLFIDQMDGVQLDKCMHALGWVAIAGTRW